MACYKKWYLGKAALPLTCRHAPPDSFFFFQSDKRYFWQHHLPANNVVMAFAQDHSHFNMLWQIGQDAIQYCVSEVCNIIWKIKKDSGGYQMTFLHK